MRLRLAKMGCLLPKWGNSTPQGKEWGVQDREDDDITSNIDFMAQKWDTQKTRTFKSWYDYNVFFPRVNQYHIFGSLGLCVLRMGEKSCANIFISFFASS